MNYRGVNNNPGSIAKDVLLGFIAGAAATSVMRKVTTYMHKHESQASRREYERVTGGKDITERTADKIERALNLDLSNQQHNLLAQSSHWGLGIGAGAAYALLRRRFDFAASGQGLAFGLAFFLLVDEGATWLTELAEAPQKYPWQAHARGLVGHLAYGLVTDTTLDLFDAVGNQLPPGLLTDGGARGSSPQAFVSS